MCHVFQSGLTALHVSAYMGHASLVTFLLENGAAIDSVNMNGETALHVAARANQTDIIRILLRGGVPVDVRAKVG